MYKMLAVRERKGVSVSLFLETDKSVGVSKRGNSSGFTLEADGISYYISAKYVARRHNSPGVNIHEDSWRPVTVRETKKKIGLFSQKSFTFIMRHVIYISERYHVKITRTWSLKILI